MARCRKQSLLIHLREYKLVAMKVKSVKFLGAILALLLSPIFSQAQDQTVYHLDTATSILHWQCANHYGTLKFSYGELHFQNEQIVLGKFDVDMNTLKDQDIDYELMQQTLVNILKSKEFFDTQSYPFSSLIIDQSQRTSDSTHHILADLHVLGGDVCIDFTATILAQNNTSLNIKSSPIIVDRTKWGIRLYSPSYPDKESNPDRFEVPDEVQFWTELNFIPIKK